MKTIICLILGGVVLTASTAALCGPTTAATDDLVKIGEDQVPPPESNASSWVSADSAGFSNKPAVQAPAYKYPVCMPVPTKPVLSQDDLKTKALARSLIKEAYEAKKELRAEKRAERRAARARKKLKGHIDKNLVFHPPRGYYKVVNFNEQEVEPKTSPKPVIPKRLLRAAKNHMRSPTTLDKQIEALGYP